MKFLSGLLVLLVPLTALAGLTQSKYVPLDLSHLSKSKTITVYEGLPRKSEKSLFREEKSRPGVFAVEDDFFYPQPLAVSADDLGALISTVRLSKNFKPFEGEKKCGGFHADYLIEWTNDKEIVGRALVCFGCSEVVFLVGGQRERVDMTPTGRAALRNLLTKYRSQRPSPPFTGVKPIQVPLPKIEPQAPAL